MRHLQDACRPARAGAGRVRRRRAFRSFRRAVRRHRVRQGRARGAVSRRRRAVPAVRGLRRRAARARVGRRSCRARSLRYAAPDGRRAPARPERSRTHDRGRRCDDRDDQRVRAARQRRADVGTGGSAGRYRDRRVRSRRATGSASSTATRIVGWGLYVHPRRAWADVHPIAAWPRCRHVAPPVGRGAGAGARGRPRRPGDRRRAHGRRCDVRGQRLHAAAHLVDPAHGPRDRAAAADGARRGSTIRPIRPRRRVAHHGHVRDRVLRVRGPVAVERGDLARDDGRARGVRARGPARRGSTATR